MTERPVGEAPRTPERAYGNGYRDGLEAGYRRGREAAAAPPQQRAILDDVLLTLDNEFGEDAPDWAFGLADRVREAAAAPPEPPRHIHEDDWETCVECAQPPDDDTVRLLRTGEADLLSDAELANFRNYATGILASRGAAPPEPPRPDPNHPDHYGYPEWPGINDFDDPPVAAPEGLSLDVLRRAFFDEYQTSHYGMSKQEAAIRADHIAPRMLARLSPSSGESE